MGLTSTMGLGFKSAKVLTLALLSVYWDAKKFYAIHGSVEISQSERFRTLDFREKKASGMRIRQVNRARKGAGKDRVPFVVRA